MVPPAGSEGVAGSEGAAAAALEEGGGGGGGGGGVAGGWSSGAEKTAVISSRNNARVRKLPPYEGTRNMLTNRCQVTLGYLSEVLAYEYAVRAGPTFFNSSYFSSAHDQ
eukprot:SAG11_NODE_2465_length_3324_cov_2.765964_5_plen_109_part_00